MIKDWIEARVWQLGTIGASAAAVGLGVALLVSGARLKDAQAARDHLQIAIDQPVTGWAARLTTCQNNTATLQASITGQNAQIDALKAEGVRRTAAAAAALADAQKETVKARANAAEIMKPLVGVDTCQRVNEADERLLEALK